MGSEGSTQNYSLVDVFSTIAFDSSGGPPRDETLPVEEPDGTKKWYSGGQLIRVDSPDGTKKHYVNGAIHRVDHPNGSTTWAETYTETKPNGDVYWYKNGVISRIDHEGVGTSSFDEEGHLQSFSNMTGYTWEFTDTCVRHYRNNILETVKYRSHSLHRWTNYYHEQINSDYRIGPTISYEMGLIGTVEWPDGVTVSFKNDLVLWYKNGTVVNVNSARSIDLSRTSVPTQNDLDVWRVRCLDKQNTGTVKALSEKQEAIADVVLGLLREHTIKQSVLWTADPHNNLVTELKLDAVTVLRICIRSEDSTLVVSGSETEGPTVKSISLKSSSVLSEKLQQLVGFAQERLPNKIHTKPELPVVGGSTIESPRRALTPCEVTRV